MSIKLGYNVQVIAKIFNVNFEKLNEVLADFDAGMTDEQCAQYMEELGSEAFYENELSLIHMYSEIYVPVNASSDQLSTLIESDINLRNIEIVSADMSKPGYVPVTVKANAPGSNITDYVIYVRVYDVNDANNGILFAGRNFIEVINLVKGETYTEQELQNEFIDNYNNYLSLYDTIAKRYLYLQISEVVSITSADTSKTGVTAAVAKVKCSMGEYDIGFLYNVYETDRIIDVVTYLDSNMVLQGCYPEITVRETSGVGRETNEREYLLGNDKISDYDPDKVGIQIISYTVEGTTYRRVVYVYTQKEALDSLGINMDPNSSDAPYDEVDINNLNFYGHIRILGRYNYFNTLEELNGLLEPLGASAVWDIDVELLDQEQNTTITVSDGNGNVIVSTGFNYCIYSYNLPKQTIEEYVLLNCNSYNVYQTSLEISEQDYTDAVADLVSSFDDSDAFDNVGSVCVLILEKFGMMKFVDAEGQEIGVAELLRTGNFVSDHSFEDYVTVNSNSENGVEIDIITVSIFGTTRDFTIRIILDNQE